MIKYLQCQIKIILALFETFVWIAENLFASKALRKKCPYSKFFCTVFSRISTEYEEIRSISLYLVRMRKNKYQNNSEYEQLSCSEGVLHFRGIT